MVAISTGQWIAIVQMKRARGENSEQNRATTAVAAETEATTMTTTNRKKSNITRKDNFELVCVCRC